MKQYMLRFGGFESFDIDCQILFLCYFHHNIKIRDKVYPQDIAKYFDELQIKDYSPADILASLIRESNVPNNTLCKKFDLPNSGKPRRCFYYLRPGVNIKLKELFFELGFKDWSYGD